MHALHSGFFIEMVMINQKKETNKIKESTADACGLLWKRFSSFRLTSFFYSLF